MKYEEKYFNRVVELTDYITSVADPKMKWMWGEALYGYSLTTLDKAMNTEKYVEFLKGYCDYYVENQPRIDQSDTSAPALITYEMQKKTGNKDYEKLTNRVLQYIRYEPRLIDDAINHLGNSPEGKLYPKSIWVDSLMMFSVFTSLYAKETKDQELLNFAARQPRLYANYMMDKKDNLWYHSYWVKSKSHYPKKKLYWGRGNGWVISALPKILDNIEGHKESEGIKEILRKTSAALLPYQREDGTFETVFNKKGKTYRELSATALIADGWLHGVRKGYLGQEYLKPAIKAFKAVVDSIYDKDGGVYLPEISGPTIPLQLFPYLGYKLTPRGKNWSYGVAALVFAAVEYKKYFQHIELK